MDKQFILSTFRIIRMSGANNDETLAGDNLEELGPLKEGQVRLVRKGKGGDIAQAAVAERVKDYTGSGFRKLDKLKQLLQERDTQLYTLACEYQEQEVSLKRSQTDFQDQEINLKRVKTSLAAKQNEVASLKLSLKKESERANKVANALAESVLGASKTQKAMPDGEAQTTPKKTYADAAAMTSPEDGSKPPAEEKTSSVEYYEDPFYLKAIKEVKLEELDLSHEATVMIPSSELSGEIVGTRFKYPVPTHLMGLIIGKGKKTLRRIYHQTYTEIEQISWTVGEGDSAERMMGFQIKGSSEAIINAVDCMIEVVNETSKDHAIRVLKGHMNSDSGKPDAGPSAPKKKPNTAGGKKPNPGGKGPKPGGSKSGGKGGNPKRSKPKPDNEICEHFLQAKCRYGINCPQAHSMGGK